MDRCSNCGLLKGSLTYGECWGCISNPNVSARRHLKFETISAYGGSCRCCGEDSLEFLTIDHINGGGNSHRRELGGTQMVFRYLRKNGYPAEGYQVLCFNCNAAKTFYGKCPHATACLPIASGI